MICIDKRNQDGIQSVSKQASKPYYEEIDVLKGIGIILMVWGHCAIPFHDFIYLFHMALFFMASGFCTYGRRINGFPSLVADIKKKVIRLYFPFIIFNSSLVLLNNFLVEAHIFDGNIKAILPTVKELVKVLLFFNYSDLSGATWFIRILFFVTVIYSLILYLSRKSKAVGITLHVLLLVICVIFAQYFSHHSFPDLFYYFVQVFSAFIAFYLGIASRTLINVVRIQKVWWSFAIFAACFGVLCICGQYGEIELAKGYITDIVYYVIVSLCGWNMIYVLALIINRFRIRTVFIYLGKHTMPIVLLHFLAFKIVTFLYLVLNHEPYNRISAHPVIYDTNILLPISYLIVGLVIPLLLEFFWSIIKRGIAK